jgi:ribosomal protein L16 Arg81 hydroxylase
LSSSALAQLLAPLDAEVFFRDYWEQRYCVVARDDAAHYETVLTRRDLDAVLHQYRQSVGTSALGGRVSLVKNSEHNAQRQPTPVNEFGLLDINALYDAYRRGFTIIVDMAQTRWPSIAGLCQDLETRLHFGVQANIYVTPRGAQGFAPHFDTHDVFVLQISGSKTWRMYEGGETLPLSDSQGQTPAGSLRAPTAEFVLRQGELLYIPRGLVHEAATTDDSSVHITLGLHVWRWADLLRDAVLSLAETDVRLRESLPVGLFAGGAVTAPESIEARMRELLHACAETADVKEGLRRLGRRLVERREPVPDGHFDSLDRLDAIEPGTWVRRRTGMLCAVLEQDDRVTIAFPGGSLTGPATLDRALRFIAAADVFQVRDLPGPACASAGHAGEAPRARGPARAQRSVRIPGRRRLTPTAPRPARTGGRPSPPRTRLPRTSPSRD